MKSVFHKINLRKSYRIIFSLGITSVRKSALIENQNHVELYQTDPIFDIFREDFFSTNARGIKGMVDL